MNMNTGGFFLMDVSTIIEILCYSIEKSQTKCLVQWVSLL